MSLNGGNVVDMHELSLTQNILDTVLQHADGQHVERINLLIGEFSDEREEAIRFYWEDLVKDTPIQTAQLHFQCMDAEMQCLNCEMVFHPEEEDTVCPRCHGFRLKLICGDDVRLESIDVE